MSNCIWLTFWQLTRKQSDLPISEEPHTLTEVWKVVLTLWVQVIHYHHVAQNTGIRLA